ncbi:lysis system i-spanin subunit Rz [Pseudomonas aeruginosa]|uniref:lysis system i-spanin subunit Rz n=1 Tax=Pseudomonas aeruginosa TaxID=287 RepID=UPI00244BA65C|nr:lysis system i-spanin subunit Rz [Pseudomonas aeruginosa]MDG9820098.1 lysis protein [Pseudomonas aeruginosa]MDG9936290.1 lysis protein [Pseudomonas aeruginosa]MDH0530267.1 lysis protein [Pseudomonas aeruginosa]MDH0536099.1 lysis protein [Pseudomonas aeruginosa]WKA34247.1 lysis system i-spanin subunit Rz [Pseudomonas aeruginosa]
MTKYLLIAVGVLAILLAGTAAAWRMSVLSNERDQYRAEAEQAKALAGDYQRRVEAGNAIERTYLEAVKSANAQNDQLRADIASGARRVYVKASCPVQHPGAATGSDAGRAELAPSDGQTVSDLRAGIERKEALIKALQEYIRKGSEQ